MRGFEGKAFALAIAAASCCAAAGPPRVQGRWLTEDRGGVVEIRPCGDALCGVIVGISEFPADGGVLRDVQGRPQCQLPLLRDMRAEDDGRWHGTVRNPEDGRVYDAEIWVGADGALRLRGYVGLELFGSTQVWPAFSGSVQADCHFKA